MPTFERPLAINPQYLALARRQTVERATAPAGQELGDDLGVEHGPARRNALTGVDEVADIGNALLQQIADPLTVASQQFGRVALLDVLREHQDRLRGRGHTQRDRGSDPLVGERRGKTNVEHDQIGMEFGNRCKQRIGVDQLTDDIVTTLVQESDDAFAQQHRILDDDDPHRHDLVTMSARRAGPRRCPP